MPTFTVYSLGDVSSFWTMLNGIAMFFNDGGFIQSAALAGSLIMLVLMLISALAKTGGGQGGHSPVLGPLYLGATFVLMSIPTSMVVEDIYTGSIIKVDNIPLIISLPSSLFTTGAYKIFKSADTVFQSVNGSYMSVSSNGLVTPMKLLMSMRKGLTGEAPVLAMNIKVFAMDCTPNSPTFDRTKLEAAPDAMDYLLSNPIPSGLTHDFPVGTTTPVDTNCSEEASILRTRLANFLGGAVLTEGDVNKIINKNMLSTPKPDKTSYNLNTDAAMPVQNLVTSQLGASAQNAQQLMSNLIMYDTINLGLDCAGTATNPGEAMACWTAVAAERQAAEQWKSDAAGAGSMFSKLMVPAIVFMQLMFYGFSPLILIFALFAGEKSIGLVAKYMMFGVWTVSWLPFAAVIQMYIQNQLIDRISLLGKLSQGGVTLSNTPEFYDMVSTNLGLASDLLAATPMMSFALLSGSAMAMTSMAGRWGGRDYTDEKAMSPDAMKTGALNNHAPAHESNQYSGSNAGYTAPNLSFSGQVGDSTSSVSAKASSDQDSLQRAFTSLDEKSKSDTSGYAWDKGGAARYTAARGNANTSQQSLANSFKTDVMDGDEKSGSFSADIAGKIAGGLSVGAALKGQSTSTIKKANAWASAHSEDVAKAQSDRKELTREASTSAKYAESHSDANASKDATSIGETIAKTTASSEAFNEQAAKGFSYSSGLAGKAPELASQLSGQASTGAMMAAIQTGYAGTGPYAEFAPQARANAADMRAGGVPNYQEAGMLQAIFSAANNGNPNAINTLNGLANLQGQAGVLGDPSKNSTLAAPAKAISQESKDAIVDSTGRGDVQGVTEQTRSQNQQAEKYLESKTSVSKAEQNLVNTAQRNATAGSSLTGPLSSTSNGESVNNVRAVVGKEGVAMESDFKNTTQLDLATRATGLAPNFGAGVDAVSAVADDYVKSVENGFDSNSFVDTALSLPFMREAAAAVDSVGSPVVNAIENGNEKLNSQQRIIAQRNAPKAKPVSDIPD